MIAGIDLGTTNSLIGVMDAGFPVLLADTDGRRLTPSAVYFPEQGLPLVGHAALRMAAIEPQSTITSVKRFMGRRGRDLGDETLELPYRVVGRNDQPAQIVVRETEVAPEVISSMILSKLKMDAESALGQEITGAVITVPAYFNDAQRAATKEAGEMAGFVVERILSEPTAAALAYGLDRLGEKSRVAVFDLGGGTFDISILQLHAGIFEVIATQGNTRLGGDDIDRALFDRLRLEGEHWRVREALIAAKHRLSEENECVITLGSGDGTLKEITISRSDLEAAARPILERTRAHCLRALADSKLQREDLDAVILVGGVTRMPLVREFVREVFGREPDTSQHPDEAVARGATIQAGVMAGTVQMILLDVTPLSLGIETFGGLMNVIIPRNSTIPCKAGEMFTNAVSGQQSMLVRVLQGEREMARDNWELGQFEIPFPPVPKGQARVGVQFSIDANGILQVLARDTASGVERVVEMKSAISVSDEAVEGMLEESLTHALEDMNQRALTEARQKAADLLAAAAKALEMAGNDLPEHEVELVRKTVAELENAMKGQSLQELKRALAALDENTQHLAALIMERLMGF